MRLNSKLYYADANAITGLVRLGIGVWLHSTAKRLERCGDCRLKHPRVIHRKKCMLRMVFTMFHRGVDSFPIVELRQISHFSPCLREKKHDPLREVEKIVGPEAEARSQEGTEVLGETAWLGNRWGRFRFLRSTLMWPWGSARNHPRLETNGAAPVRPGLN